MKSATFRIIACLIAIIISSMIVLGLSHAGQSTKGPIENVMSYTGEVVKDLEQKLIVEQREEKRSDKLQWLKPYTESRKMLKSPGKILLGAFDNETTEDFESIVNLEDSLKTTFPLIHIYKAWGSKPDERFPTAQVKNIIELGSVPVVTWEPWLSDFDEEVYPGSHKPDDPNKNGMKDIAAGIYDTYIANWAAAAKKINHPVFLRFGHEMNDGYRYPWGPQNNTAPDFIAAWQHVHDVFLKEGAKNIIWIWSPHPAYEFKDFYPGDAYVDYVGAGVLNYGSIAVWSKWWSFKEIFGTYYPQLASYNKPIMITEFGSLNVGGNRSKWFAAALDSLPQHYPLIKSILFFHFSKDNTTTQQTLNWYFKGDRAVTGTIAKEITKWKQ
jgi:glycosyl hydrolase family 26